MDPNLLLGLGALLLAAVLVAERFLRAHDLAALRCAARPTGPARCCRSCC
jgi:hypothetical protein